MVDGGPEGIERGHKGGGQGEPEWVKKVLEGVKEELRGSRGSMRGSVGDLRASRGT